MTDDFNPIRALAGEPVQFCKTGGTWVDVHFVGLTQDGTPLVQFERGDTIMSYALRMKPVPVTTWVLEFSSEAAATAAAHVLKKCSAKWSVPEVKRVEVKP